jgi:hypothetical protein
VQGADLLDRLDRVQLVVIAFQNGIVDCYL